jgi:hypothetical protein
MKIFQKIVSGCSEICKTKEGAEEIVQGFIEAN